MNKSTVVIIVTGDQGWQVQRMSCDTPANRLSRHGDAGISLDSVPDEQLTLDGVWMDDSDK